MKRASLAGGVRSALVVAATLVVVTSMVGSFGLVPAGVAPVGTAAAAPVSGCTTISSPGVYNLTGDVTNSSTSECISIESSDVVFDGMGNTIDGVDDAGNSIGVNVSAGTVLSNVTVRNVTVIDFDSGVEYVDAAGEIEQANLTSNARYGVYALGPETVNVTDSVLSSNPSGIQGQFDSSVFRNNTFEDNNFGVYLLAGSGSVVVDNTFAPAAGGTGVEIEDVDGMTVRENTFTGGQYAVVDELQNFPISGSNVIRGNVISSPNETGIVVRDGREGTQVVNNTVTDSGGQGINVSSANSTVLTNNVINNSSDRGILVNSSSGVVVNGSATNVSNSGNQGIALANADDTTVESVTVVRNDDYQIFVGPDSSGVSVVGTNVDERGTSLPGIKVEADGTVVRANDLNENYNSISVNDAAGVVIEDNTVTNGLGGGDVSVLGSVTEDVIIRNNTLTTDNRPIFVGSGVSNATIVDNTVDGNFFGIEIRGDGTDHLIANNDVTTSGGNGIQIQEGASGSPTGTVVRDNTITDVGANGTLVDSASGTVLTDNVIQNSADRGIYVDNSSNVVINGSATNVSKSGAGGIEFRESSDSVVRDVTVYDSDSNGISIDANAIGPSNVTVDNVTTELNSNGVQIADVTDVRVLNSEISDSSSRAVLIQVNSDRAVVRNNDISGSFGFSAIAASGMDDVTIEDNSLSGGSSGGIELGATSGAVVRNNTVTGFAGDGINAETNVQNPTFVNNTVQNAGENGFFLEDADGAVLTNNVIENSADRGIYVNDSSNVVINGSATNVSGSGSDGIELQRANDSVVRDVTVTNNGNAGVFVTVSPSNSASNVTVDDVTATDHGTYGVWINRVTNSRVLNSNASSNANGGINIARATGALVGSNEVVDNENGEGVDVRRSTDTIVVANQIEQNSAGVEVYDATNVTVRDNSVFFAQDNGTLIRENSQNVVLTNNTISTADKAGIAVTNSSNVVVNGTATTITGNQRGIELRNASSATIADAQVTDNGFEGGIATYVAAPDLTIRDVNASANDGNGITLSDASNFEVANVTASDNTGSVINGFAVSVAAGPGEVRDSEFVGNGDNGVAVFATSDVAITGTLVADNGEAGFKIYGGSENTLVRNSTATNNAVADVLIDDGATVNTTVENLDLRDSTSPNTTLSFTGKYLRVSGVGSPPADPSGEVNVGRYFNATKSDPNGFLEFTLQYEDGDVSGVDESQLDIWRYDGTWSELGGTVDEANNTISYTEMVLASVYAPMAPPPQSITVTDGGTPEDITIGDSVQSVDDARVEGIDDSTIKLYYNVTSLVTHDVDVGPLNVDNFVATNGTAGATSVDQNGGVTVVELTVNDLGSFDATEVSFDLIQLGTSGARTDTGITYDVNVSEGTTSDSNFDASNGNAPDADDVQTAPFAITGSPDFQVSDLVTNSPVTEGDRLTVEATVSNDGAGGTQTVALDVGGTERDSTELTLAGGENRTVTISWTTTDGDAGNYTASVATANDTEETDVEVEAAVGPVTATDDSYDSFENETLVVSAPGVLANDDSANNGSLSASLVSGPAHGSLVLSADGSFEYDPARGYSGGDTFTYRVTDETGASDEATVRIAVQNRKPSVVLNVDRVVESGETIELDGSSSRDPDGDALQYSWFQTRGPDGTFLDRNGSVATITVPEVNETTTIGFGLAVFDGTTGAETVATVTVEPSDDSRDDPANEPPVAAVGPDRTVESGTGVTLDARNSTDPDGDALTYEWTQTGGPSVTLSDADTATPTFTAPTVEGTETLSFRVTVSDGEASSTATVDVTVGEPVDVVDRFDVDDSGEIETDEFQTAIRAWATGEITTEELRTVLSSWLTAG